MARYLFKRIIQVFIPGITIGLTTHYSLSSPDSRSVSQTAWSLPNSLHDFSRGLIHEASAASSSIKEALQPPTPWNWNWDGRHLSETTKTSPQSASGDKAGDCDIPMPRHSRHILMVRHGQYHFASDDVDCHLTELGRQQTDLTGQRLKQLAFPYSRIVYSTMTRAVESTEEIIKHLPGVPAMPNALLREGAPFPPEPPVKGWPASPDAFATDGPRIESAWSVLIHRAPVCQTEDSYEIYVCHANVIRYFVCRSLQLPPEAWIRFSLDHGSITWLTVRPGGTVSLRWLGNSGHMPPDKTSLQ